MLWVCDGRAGTMWFWGDFRLTGLRVGMRGKFRGIPAIRNGGFGGVGAYVDCDCGAELRSCQVAAAFFT